MALMRYTTQTPLSYQRQSERNLKAAEDELGQGRAAYKTAMSSSLGNANLGRGLLRQYQNTFAPVAGQMISQANTAPDYMVDRSAVDAGMAYDTARGEMLRNAARMGVNPNSGRFAGLEQKWALAKAAAVAGAKNRARSQAQDVKFSRLAQAYSAGQPLLGAGLGAIERAPGDIMSAGDRLGGTTGARRGLAADWGDIAAGAGALETRFPQAPSTGYVPPAGRGLQSYVVAGAPALSNERSGLSPMPWTTEEYMAGAGSTPSYTMGPTGPAPRLMPSGPADQGPATEYHDEAQPTADQIAKGTAERYYDVSPIGEGLTDYELKAWMGLDDGALPTGTEGA